MKKLVLAILVALIASFDLCAVFVSVNLINANGSFDSPSNLQKIGISSDFAVRFNYFTDVDNIMFLANPISVLAFSSQPYVSFLLAQQTSFFDANRGVTGLFNSYDANAPVYDSTYPEASVDAFKRYLRDSFSSLSDSRKAFIIRDMVASYPGMVDSPIHGKLDASLALYGYNLEKPFSWGWSVNVYYSGAFELLSNESGRLNLDARFNLGYSFSITEKLRAGVSFSPMLLLFNLIDNISFINARIGGNGALLFTNEFFFGTGFVTNIGLSYDISDEFSLSPDLRNVPSMQSYAYVSLADLASVRFNFHTIKDIFIREPDAVLAAVYTYKQKTIFRIEIGEVLSQLLTHFHDDSYSMDYYDILKLSVAHTVDPDFSIVIGAGNNMLEMRFKIPHFTFGAAASLNRWGFGLSVAYEM